MSWPNCAVIDLKHWALPGLPSGKALESFHSFGFLTPQLEIKIDSLEAGQHHYFPQAMTTKKVAAIRSSESLLQVADSLSGFSSKWRSSNVLAGMKKSPLGRWKSSEFTRSHLIQSSRHQIAFDKVQLEEEIRLEIFKMFLAKLRYHCEINFLVMKSSLLRFSNRMCPLHICVESNQFEIFFLIFRLSRKTSELKAYQDGSEQSLEQFAERTSSVREKWNHGELSPSCRQIENRIDWGKQKRQQSLGALEWNYSQLKSQRSGKRRLSGRMKASWRKEKLFCDKIAQDFPLCAFARSIKQASRSRTPHKRLIYSSIVNTRRGKGLSLLEVFSHKITEHSPRALHHRLTQ